MKALLLDQDAWDLVLTASGNWAVADDPYAIAQNVACAVRTFAAECWYDTTLGIPYFDEILGHWAPIALMQSLIEAEALKVTGVNTARCTITSFTNRAPTGQILLNGTQNVDF